MGKIKGQNLRVFLGGTVVAKATNCQLQIQNSSEDITTKDNAALASEETVVSSSWQVQVDSFDETNITALLTAWKNNTPFQVKWDQTGGTGNAVGQGASFLRVGQAYISDATFNFNDREVVASNVTFVGDGELQTDEP